MSHFYSFRATHPVRLQAGFSLVEMMIVVVIVGILTISGITWGQDYIANSRVRSAAESLRSALTLARDEAITRNRLVGMVLDSAANEWRVVEFAGTPPVAVNPPIRVGSYLDTQKVAYPPDTTVTFNGLGQANAGRTFRVKSYPEVGTCQDAGGKIRCLDVRLLAGGQATMCDPSLEYAKDPRGCKP